MLGTVAGDIVGSGYGARQPVAIDFPLFTPGSTVTDGTVLTVATAQGLLRGIPYAECFRDIARKHPAAGYGPALRHWLTGEGIPQDGGRANTAARRVVPIGLVAGSLAFALEETYRNTIVTQRHPEAIRGAQAVAMAVYLARTGVGKPVIRREITLRFGYDLSASVPMMREPGRNDASSDGTVPGAIIAFLASEDVESAIRLAVSLGGPAEAQGAIAGGIAEAFYGRIPGWLAIEALERLPRGLDAIVREFLLHYGVRG